MSTSPTAVKQEFEDYINCHSTPPDRLLVELADETARLGGPAVMQIAKLQGTLMGLLARLIGARRAIEIGTFTGYSAISVARALPDDGKLICCDVSEAWTSIARRYFPPDALAHHNDLLLAAA